MIMAQAYASLCTIMTKNGYNFHLRGITCYCPIHDFLGGWACPAQSKPTSGISVVLLIEQQPLRRDIRVLAIPERMWCWGILRFEPEKKHVEEKPLLVITEVSKYHS